MKKSLLILLVAIFDTLCAHAHKAWPYPMTFVQSNGTTITVQLHGDDTFSWYTDMNGNILERHGNDFKKLSVDPTTYLTRARQATRTRAMRREPIATSTAIFPHTGSPKVLVILAEYQDKKFALKNPRASFEQYFNATDGHPRNLGNGENRNYGSVRQYFMAQSNGRFCPQFDIQGPITLPEKMAYYGGTDPNGRGERHTQLLKDACAAVDQSVDFAPYDQDNDGNIDLVYVVYAGQGQSSGGAVETMWPKRFFGFSDVKFDGKGVNQCGISNELFGQSTDQINGIGLFCHEFSHCLGLPDFYPTTLDDTHDNQGMEDWDLMDGGEYVGGGFCPTAYTAWEREAMGWDHIPTLTEAAHVRLDGSVSGGTNAVKVVNPNDANEYFVLQLFEDKGWNQRIAWHKGKDKDNVEYDPSTKGLLIYHVNYNATLFSLMANNVNNEVGKPRMTVVPADGRLVSSYRIGKQTSGNTISRLDYAEQVNGDIFRVDDEHADSTFSQSMDLPNAKWRVSAPDMPIYNITYKDDCVYIDYLKHLTPAGIAERHIDPSLAKMIYTIDGRRMGTSIEALPKGIYIRGGKKFVK